MKKAKVAGKAEEPKPNEQDVPALFATIHFRSERRPEGYTDDEIAELNRAANVKSKSNERVRKID